jgi:hypothetical protein
VSAKGAININLFSKPASAFDFNFWSSVTDKSFLFAFGTPANVFSKSEIGHASALRVDPPNICEIVVVDVVADRVVGVVDLRVRDISLYQSRILNQSISQSQIFDSNSDSLQF